MTRPIGVGVIGCGEVAQIIHLPPLHELRDLFSVTALCGVSASVLAGIGAMHQGARLYADYRSLSPTRRSMRCPSATRTPTTPKR